MKFFYIILILVSFLQAQCQTKLQQISAQAKELQDAIIKEHVYDCADTYNYKYMMKEYQDCLDAGLKKDSTIAYLWQQKAMPYFKARKYEIGMPFIDKAVFYDEQRWLPYRAFIKCIFQKNYKDAIADFEKCMEKYGNNYEMDHTYSFYIALSHLQLNSFAVAEQLFKKDIVEQKKRLEDAHFVDLFYYGISKYEQGKWEEAIVEFDKSLKQYPQFSEVQMYKAVCLFRLNRSDEGYELLAVAKENAKIGYTMNEDNAIYEMYPYQIRWNK